MKLTYEIIEDPEHPGFLRAWTQLEDDDGQPLVDVKLSMFPEMVPVQIPAVSHTLLRWWHKKNGAPMPANADFKTLGEATTEGAIK